MATDEAAARNPSRFTELWEAMSPTNRLILGGIAVAILLAIVALVASGVQGRSNMVPLLVGYNFTPTEMQEAIRAFGPNRTDYTLHGSQILVPRNRESEYLSALAEGNAYPDNFYKAFDDYIANERTWWSSQADAQRQIFIAKQRVLAKMISSFPEIANASVVVTNPASVGLRRAAPRKATVRVSVLGRQPLSPLRQEEIRHMVASSFEYLDPSAVYVAGDALLAGGAGRGHGTGMSGDTCVDTTLSKLNNPHLLSKESYAECIEHDILRMLSHLDGVSVVANVEVDLDKRIDQVITQHEKGAVVRRDSTSRNSESTSAAAREGEPGVRTNADEPGVAPNQGATAATAPTNTETDESTTEEMIPNRIETTKEIAGLTPNKVGVVISVPRRYLEATTDDAGVAQPPAMTEAEIISSVIALGYPGLTEESVRVVRFTPAPMPPEDELAAYSILDIAFENLSSILFGLLGVAAIIFALIVSRRTPVEKVDKTAFEEEIRDQDEEPLLPELPPDASALRYEKMQETINQMVGSSPESAASLVRRWIVEDEL